MIGLKAIRLRQTRHLFQQQYLFTLFERPKMNLDHKDIDLLIDGLESIEKAAKAEDSMGGMITALFSSMAFKDDPTAMDKAKRERELEVEKSRLARRRKQEDVFLLRAKLVTIRRELDSEVASRIVDEAQRS